MTSSISDAVSAGAVGGAVGAVGGFVLLILIVLLFIVSYCVLHRNKRRRQYNNTFKDASTLCTNPTFGNELADIIPDENLADSVPDENLAVGADITIIKNNSEIESRFCKCACMYKSYLDHHFVNTVCVCS